MSIHQHATLEDTVYFWFAANDTSGSGGDGASPVYDVRLGGAAAGAIPTLSGSATLLSHANYAAGCHEIAVAATAGNGFAATNTYGVFCTLLVDSQNPSGFAGSFTLDPMIANVKEWQDVATVAGAIPAVAADGVGGLPISDAGGLDLDTILTTGAASPVVIEHKKGVEYTLTFPMVDSTSPGSFKTGLSPTDTAYRATDGGGGWTVLGIDDTASEIGTTGVYEIQLIAGEMNYDYVMVKLSAAGAADLCFIFNTRGAQAEDLLSGLTDILADTNELQTDNIPGLLTTAQADLDTITGTGGVLIGTDAMDRSGTLDVNTKTATATALDLVLKTSTFALAMADAIWDELLAGHTTADTAGLVLNEWQNGGRLDLILDAILVDTAVIGALGAGLTNIPWNASWDAEVQSEVNDALDTAISELGVAAPTATPTIRTALMLLYMPLRNQIISQTSGTDALQIYNDAGTLICKKLMTDVAGDYTEAKMTSG